MFGYEFTQNLIGILPFVIMITTYLLMLRGERPLKWYWRTPIMILLGWFVTLCHSILFFYYSIHYAPTEEIKLYLIKNDGGLHSLALLFGWVLGLACLISIEILRSIVKDLLYINKNNLLKKSE